MSFNIQHGLNGDGTKYGLNLAADTIARVNPDIVGVQELTRNHPSYNCEDQPALLSLAITASTGRKWNPFYHQEWFTPDRSCQSSGRGDGPETEGSAFLSPDPIPSPTTTPLFNGRLGMLTELQRGRAIAIVLTHLANGQERQSERMKQLDDLLPWARTVSGQGPRLLICDCNLWPDSPEYKRIRESYSDAWVDAVSKGVTRGRLDGITHKTVRIDYIFYNPDQLELLWMENIDTRPLVGTDASDHNPIQAAFRAR